MREVEFEKGMLEPRRKVKKGDLVYGRQSKNGNRGRSR